MKVRELPKGAYFARKPTSTPSAKQVFIRGDYDRSQRKYECVCFDDANRFIYLKGDAEVYTDFVF